MQHLDCHLCSSQEIIPQWVIDVKPIGALLTVPSAKLELFLAVRRRYGHEGCDVFWGTTKVLQSPPSAVLVEIST
jgi:hypothetical protein